ncbi:MAG: hypothetical protein LBS46_08345 [Dysgonamonadaceae bacterium]|nr:hypothetical protein [Dysgonamonadaceae bacterium]
MKKISLKGITKILSDGELKDVKGRAQDPVGGFANIMIMPDDMVVVGEGGGNGFWEGNKPCPEPEYRACNGPAGTRAGGGICCLVPCYGWLHDYGYAILTGLSKCPG